MNVKPTKGYICKTSGLYLNHDDGHPIQHTNFGVARDIDCQLTDTPLREYNPYLEKHTTEYPWDLEPTERLLWDFLIHKFNQDYRGLWWSTRKIALRLKKTPRTIEAALKKLIAKKWIEVEKPGGVNGKKRFVYSTIFSCPNMNLYWDLRDIPKRMAKLPSGKALVQKEPGRKIRRVKLIAWDMDRMDKARLVTKLWSVPELSELLFELRIQKPKGKEQLKLLWEIDRILEQYGEKEKV